MPPSAIQQVYAQNRSRFVIGSPALLMNLKRINNLIKLQNKKRRFLSVFVLVVIHKSNRPHFPGVYQRNKATWDVERTLEKLVNHSAAARDLQAFSCSPKIPRGFITLVNPWKVRSIA